MKTIMSLIAIAVLTAASPSSMLTAATDPEPKTYTGVITETMCKRDHKSMNIAPDAKCVRDCVGDGKTYKYALLVGESLYTLSDQETPARFAAQRVHVTGVLYTKTNIIKVESIKAAK